MTTKSIEERATQHFRRIYQGEQDNIYLSLVEIATEQDRISRQEERERCIKAVQECYCKSRCSFYKNGECELAENFDKVGVTCIFHKRVRKAIEKGGEG